MLEIVSWFVLGVLVGSALFAIMAIAAIRHEENKETKEEFVKKLVKEKGWTEARWELETAFRGKYMRTWRRLYKKHIEEKDNGKN